ncbi:MAG: hypothetical protein JOZ92_06445 [Candidatus Dormibacteraeota bacterium]|nr:hypothetical protein [Candidatus Dormibacteraeota bacterium]
MARTYAQFAALVFLVVGAGGFLVGDSHVVNGAATGNFGSVSLHLTYTRDVLDLLLAAVFAYAGFVASARDAWIPLLGAGAVLLILAVVGFLHADTDAGGNAVASLHFPLAMNVFDLIAGVMTLLCALGALAEEPTTAAPR